MPANWDKARADAKKLLGDKGEVPEMPDALSGGIDKGRDTADAMKSVLSEVQAKLVDLQKACGDVVRAGQQFQSSLAKETFGLDPKNADDAKKIQKARAVLDAYLSKANKVTGDALAPMAKFENAVSSFQKDCAL
jgi:hypothetical protein